MTAPAKKWRVYGARGISIDFRSQRAAYEDVKAIVAGGVAAKVYHWEGGAWQLYERIQPPGVSPGRSDVTCGGTDTSTSQ